MSIDVAVMDRRQPVSGLTVADFELFDNSVRQTVAVVAMASVPLDVSVLLDVSGSFLGHAENLNVVIKGIRDSLQAVDRFELVAFGSDVRTVIPLGSSPEVSNGVRDLWKGTSLYDGLALAMIRKPDPHRRQLVAVLTDGTDTFSAMDLASVKSVALRSPVTMCMGLLSSKPESLRGMSPRLPFAEKDLAGLNELTTLTGGQFLSFDQTPAKSPVEVFEAILQQFRMSYVLTYAPSGVARAGEHRIEIRVPSRPRSVITHRTRFILPN